MNNNNDRYNEMVELNEELKYTKNYFKKFNLNLIKLNVKVKKIILKKLLKTINHKKLNSKIKNETLEFINKNIKSKKSLNNIKSIENFELVKNYKDLKQLKDLKKGFQYPVLWRQTNKLLNKELKILENKKIKLNKKISKLKQKEKRNYIQKHLLQRNEINLIKINTRIKDVNSLIKNKATYKKLYLSDEIPLTPLGWIKLLISYGLLIFWALIILWPLGELVKLTLNDRAVGYLNVKVYEFGFSSFKRLFNNTNYSLWMQNTIYVSIITSICTVFSALLMGYAFSRFRFKGRKSSLLSVMLLQMIPTLSALTVFYVLYTVLKQEYAISGLTVLLLIYIGGGVAGNTFIMKGYMDSISTDIDEAAKIDGLSQWKIFTKIIIPLTKPMIALVGLWSFIGPFGDYILPGLLLNQNEDFTLAKGIRILITDQQKLDQSAFAAGALLVAVPISVLFILLKNFLIGGITSGGVKG